MRAVQGDKEGGAEVRVGHVVHGERLVVGEVEDLPAVTVVVRHVCKEHLPTDNSCFSWSSCWGGLCVKSIITLFIFLDPYRNLGIFGEGEVLGGFGTRLRAKYGPAWIKIFLFWNQSVVFKDMTVDLRCFSFTEL